MVSLEGRSSPAPVPMPSAPLRRSVRPLRSDPVAIPEESTWPGSPAGRCRIRLPLVMPKSSMARALENFDPASVTRAQPMLISSTPRDSPVSGSTSSSPGANTSQICPGSTPLAAVRLKLITPMVYARTFGGRTASVMVLAAAEEKAATTSPMRRFVRRPSSRAPVMISLTADSSSCTLVDSSSVPLVVS